MAGDRAQLQHRLRTVDDESGMHLDGDFHAVIGGKFCVLGPVRNDFLLPLPIQQFQEIGRPGAGHPVGKLGIVAVARTSGEVDDHRNAEFLGQQDGLLVDFLRFV